MWFKMVEYRLLVENQSVEVTSQANALAPLKGKDVIILLIIIMIKIIFTMMVVTIMMMIVI